MTGRELVQASPQTEGQVRSYHRAFNLELTIYTIGDNIRLWWPIPVRGIFWAILVEIIMLILTSVSGFSAPMLSMDWGFLYIVIPIGLAWLFAGAKPEGRRLHVTLISWASRTITGRQTVGGYKRLQHVDRMRGAKVKTRALYEPRKAVRWERPAAAVMSVLLVLFLAIHFLGGSNPGVAASAAATTVPTPTRHLTAQARLARPARPAFPPARGVPASSQPHKSTVAKHRAHKAAKKHIVSHPKPVVHRAPAVSHRAPVAHTAPVVVPHRSTYVPVYRTAPPVSHVAPIVVRTPQPQPAPVHSSPQPQRAPCYPGELGC